MRRLQGALAAAALMLLPACHSSSAAGGGSPPPANVAVTVDIKNIAFNPQSVTIKSGQTVAWKFDDAGIYHNVVGDTFRSGDRLSGYFTYTFTGPGTYAYRCTIHSGMTGEVVVTP